MEDKKNIKMMAVAAVVFLFALYRLGSPFLKETQKMAAAAEKIEKAVVAVRQEAAMYGLGWEKTMGGRETLVMQRLPDTLRSSEVLKYFLTDFETQHAGKVAFTSVNHQKAQESEFKSGEGGKAARARAIRYKIRADLSQDKVVPYFEHIERYPGLVNNAGFSFRVGDAKSSALEMELNLDLFLTPKAWVPKEVREKEEEPAVAEGASSKRWTEIFASPANGRGIASQSGRVPAFQKIVGGNVVADESLYEEGDSINGWKILKIDKRKNTVTLKWGNVKKEVRVK